MLYNYLTAPCPDSKRSSPQPSSDRKTLPS
jgi:hypothetical protein